MPTAQVLINVDGKDHGPVRALLDTGSQAKLVTNQLVERWLLSRKRAARKAIGVNSQPVQIEYKTAIRVSQRFYSKVVIEQEF